MSEERPPISWDALAAELESTREEAAARGVAAGDADPSAWDAVARELASRVADRPGDPEVLPPVDEPAPLPPPVAATPAPAPEADDEPEQLEIAVLDAADLRGGLEALLFVVDNAVDEATLAGALRCPPSQVSAGLRDLAADYDARRAGITLRQVGDGWRLYTREEFAEVVERYLVGGQQSRLTQAALETLAVIAYRQPVTRARVSAIRGVGVDGVMRTLIARGLVHEVGTDPDSGGGLYETTPLFLERLGLSSLAELPELAPLLPETSAVLDEHPDA
jgi:segregation and condensation protein B